MEKVSFLTHLLLVLSTIFVIFQLYKAAHKSRAVLTALILWAVITSILGLAGFYQQGYVMPPRFLFLVGPGVAAVILLFSHPRGRAFVDSLKISDLTLLQSVRFPVEIVLYYLFVASAVPEMMTFEGWNFDILTGLSAPFVYYFAFRRKLLKSGGLLIWNFAGLLLLFTIVTIAILSLSTPFQQLAFEQPNVGVTYFPYVWLPGIIVPAALLSHLVSIRQLLYVQAGKKLRSNPAVLMQEDFPKKPESPTYP